MTRCIPALLVSALIVSAFAWTARTSSIQAPSFPNLQISHNGAYEECSLAVNPADPANLLGMAMFAPNTSAPGSEPATFTSLDSGRTWHENGPLSLPAGFEIGVDPSVTFSSKGHGFLCYRLDGAGEAGARPQGVFIWNTDDGGRTFTQPHPVLVTHRSRLDHPSIAAGKTTAGADALFVAWTAEDDRSTFIAFSRSTDEGQHFESPLKISGLNDRMAASPIVAAGSKGRVYVVYISPPNGQRSYAGARNIEIVTSSDDGKHFDAPRTIGSTATVAGAVAQLPTGAAIAVQPGDGYPHADKLYVVYSPYRGATRHSDVAMVRSKDSGQNWLRPSIVAGAPPGAETDYFQPMVAVTATGIVCVSFYTVTNISSDTNQSLMNVDLACSRDRGLNFASALRITSEPFKYGLGNRFKFRGREFSSFGDYQGIAAGPTAIHLLWTDSRTGRTALSSAVVPIDRLER